MLSSNVTLTLTLTLTQCLTLIQYLTLTQSLTLNPTLIRCQPLRWPRKSIFYKLIDTLKTVRTRKFYKSS